MKIRTIVLGFLLGTIALAVCFEYSWAESKTDKNSLKIGVVAVRKIFRDCKRSVKYRQEAAAESSRISAELEKLRAEINAEETGLRTLKIGSNDHMAQVKEILQKRASFQVQDEFYKQQIALKQRRMVEGLYKEILRETGEIAKQKNLDLVFEKSDLELSVLSSRELDEAISTHKLLYSGGCLDITDEVITKVDEGE